MSQNVKTSDVLEEVFFERERQDAKWGEQNHEDGTSHDLYSRTASHNRFIADCAYRDGNLTWRDILLEEVYEALSEDEINSSRLRQELVQVAAVAVAWIEAIDRRGGAGK